MGRFKEAESPAPPKPAVRKREPRPVMPPKPVKPKGETLRVSTYDQVSSMLSAALLTIGFITTLMFLIWYLSQIRPRSAVVPVKMIDGLGGGGSGNNQPGAEQNLEEPSPEELPDVQEMPVDKLIDTVAAVVATQEVDLESLENSVAGLGHGQGTGQGDGRGLGPGGPGTATMLPEWQVKFIGTSLEQYAAQLDYFRIELAAIGGGRTEVDYASFLSAPKPKTRSGAGAAEKRRYLLWRKGPLADADKQLLTRAGIDPSGRVISQFIPPDVEQVMAQLEADYSKGKKLDQIRKTVFGVQGSPGAYKFYVISQDLR